METTVVYEPITAPSRQHRRATVFIATGFFLFVQLFVLQGVELRVFFTVLFALFMFVGLWLSRRTYQTWPERIVLDAQGLSSSRLRLRHGVARVPWCEIERMDLFASSPRMAPFLRIALREGAFKRGLPRLPFQALSMGWDVNIPVYVDAPPDEVLRQAQQFQAHYRDGTSPRQP